MCAVRYRFYSFFFVFYWENFQKFPPQKIPKKNDEKIPSMKISKNEFFVEEKLIKYTN
jgi:hypothetical protein